MSKQFLAKIFLILSVIVLTGVIFVWRFWSEIGAAAFFACGDTACSSIANFLLIALSIYIVITSALPGVFIYAFATNNKKLPLIFSGIAAVYEVPFLFSESWSFGLMSFLIGTPSILIFCILLLTGIWSRIKSVSVYVFRIEYLIFAALSLAVLFPSIRSSASSLEISAQNFPEGVAYYVGKEGVESINSDGEKKALSCKGFLLRPLISWKQDWMLCGQLLINLKDGSSKKFPLDVDNFEIYQNSLSLDDKSLLIFETLDRFGGLEAQLGTSRELYRVDISSLGSLEEPPDIRIHYKSDADYHIGYAEYSPDGKKIAVLLLLTDYRKKEMKSKIVILSKDGIEETEFTAPSYRSKIFTPRWFNDSKNLFYIVIEDSHSKYFLGNKETGEIRVWDGEGSTAAPSAYGYSNNLEDVSLVRDEDEFTVFTYKGELINPRQDVSYGKESIYQVIIDQTTKYFLGDTENGEIKSLNPEFPLGLSRDSLGNLAFDGKENLYYAFEEYERGNPQRGLIIYRFSISTQETEVSNEFDFPVIGGMNYKFFTHDGKYFMYELREGVDRSLITTWIVKSENGDSVRVFEEERILTDVAAVGSRVQPPFVWWFY